MVMHHEFAKLPNSGILKQASECTSHCGHLVWRDGQMYAATVNLKTQWKLNETKLLSIEHSK